MQTCNQCGAPSDVNAMACAYCGAAQRTPRTVEEELTMVREQGMAAQRLASQPNADMRIFWQGAYVPSTVEALRIALQATASALPEITDYQHALARQAEFGEVHARAVTLVEALRFHPQAPEVTRQEAARFRRVVHERKEEFRVALRRDNALGVVMSVGVFGSGIAALVGFNSNFAAGLTMYAALLALGFFVRHKMLEQRPYAE